MKCAQVILFTTILVLCTFQWSSADPPTDFLTGLGIDIYKKLNSKNPGKNIFFSPLGISTALSLVHLGAKGNTKTQLKNVLKLDSLTDDKINKEFKRIIDALEKKDHSYTVHLANGLFVSKKFSLNPAYSKDSQTYFHSTPKNVDFSKPENSRKTINDWVSKETNGIIKEFILKDNITQSTVLEIVNALLVKAQWKYPFNVSDTKKDTFTTSKGDKIPMDMMHLPPKRLNYVFSKELNCELVELPFYGDKLSMYILLPKESGIETVQKKLTPESLQKVREILKEAVVEVILPKFITDQRISLTSHLKTLGMTDLFDVKKSDLSRIIKGGRGLYASQMVHKNYFRVDENGVEATSAISLPSTVPTKPKPILFKANKPFLFMIGEKIAHVVVFCGHVITKPVLNDVLN